MPLIILLISLISNAKVPIITMDDSEALYIVDGDSISLSMRIKGIDAPERDQKCEKIKNKIINCGIVAKEHLKILLDYLPGKLTIKPVGIGHYSRVLVHVYKGKVDVGRMMVEDGFAYAFSKKYKAAEASAKKDKKGFWGYYTPPVSPEKWRKKYLKKF